MMRPEPLRFREAEAFWSQRIPMGPGEFARLTDAERVRAFSVSGFARLETIQDLYESLGNVVRNGESFESWKGRFADLWERKGWTGKAAWRIDNIYRTNIQTAFQAGRFRTMRRTVKTRPYWQYSAVNDGRTRPTHRGMHGWVARWDDPIWKVWWPPNGYRCRCTMKSLSAAQVKARGLTPRTGLPGLVEPIDPKTGRKLPARPALPDPGFGINPGEVAFKPDLTKTPAHFRQTYLEGFLDAACPDDKLDFSADDCLKRLKKHLTQMDIEDLQLLASTERQRLTNDFPGWAGAVLETMTPKGETFPIGNIPLRVLARIEAKPRLALVMMDDKALAHLARGGKKPSQQLTKDEILAIPEKMRKADWYLDTQDPALLATWIRAEAEDVWIKVVVRMDRKVGKGVANVVTTAGAVMRPDIENDPRYRKIGGQ